MNELFSMYSNWSKTLLAQLTAAAYFAEGATSYHEDFIKPLISATRIFQKTEATRLLNRDPLKTLEAYYKLFRYNNELFTRYTHGSLKISSLYFQKNLEQYLQAATATIDGKNGKQLADFFIEKQEDLQRVIVEYPQAIKDIEPEFGFHFEKQPKSLCAETDRFVLRKVFPTEPGVKTDKSMKPVIIIPPFVLGANILAFLPQEKKSYAHSFANHGIPTYIRTMKDIQTTPALQTMSLEDDLHDTVYFCEKVKKEHGSMVTLNGYCQGGFSALCNLLTGELDGLVDALITCVAPMDGTRSIGLGNFLKSLPEEFNDLAFGTKTLANGNEIADGNLMGWVYKLKSIEDSGPMANFFKDLMMLGNRNGKAPLINKTVAALNYWLQNERSDLPLSVTRMSYNSYNIPISDDGTLPITISGKKLNLKSLRDSHLRWLLCYGETDDLVEKEVALAPLQWVQPEVSPFPKGHVAIATSWSHPDSTFAIDKLFEDGKHRGPVRFQLDLNEEMRSTSS
jgi:hypothetical protein